MDFFAKSEPIRGMQGDTFPTFEVVVSGINLVGCSMVLELEDRHRPGTVVLSKNGSLFTEDGRKGYCFNLQTTDTSNLSGMYNMHFILTDSNSKQYRKLIGVLEVLPAPEVET